MAIILPHGRPAIDVLAGSYSAPGEPWGHLDSPVVRGRLEPAIGAVGRIQLADDDRRGFFGTAFVVGPNLLLSMSFGDPRSTAAGARMVVDFGHELLPAASVRVDVTEVVRVDPQYHFELIRADLPATISPLRLSARPPAELVDRDVVLIGYPTVDSRNDAALLNRIFRGAMDVKRLLPGRSHGADTFSRGGGELEVLAHDCSSTGGCGGGPVIDVETGEVLGMHFAGLALQTNYAVPAPVLADLLRGTGSRSIGLPTRPAGRPPTVEPPAAEVPVPGPPPRTGTVAALSAYDDDVLASDRPALTAASWESELNGPWAAVLTPRQPQLTLAMRAVGKVQPNLGQPAWNGGAFVVGDRLALTASFCAQAFTDGGGADAVIRPGFAPAVDFSDALRQPPGTATARVTGVRFIHPSFHVALLELAELPDGVGLLDLASQLPSGLSGRLVTLLAFAADRGGGLYLQPGKALQVGELPDTSRLPALAHDCGSGSGSAGGPVIDLDTGYVLGVHTHRKPGSGGFAQPAWELARDPHVWEHEIRFQPDPRPSWLAAWDIPEARPAEPDPLPPEPNGRWTVDEIPINWALPEPQHLEQLLRESIPDQFARFHVENAGVPLGMINFGVPPQLLWRDILRIASVSGALRRLVEMTAALPEYAGIAPKLRVYL